MANIRKLSNFRQLSINCECHKIDHRKSSLKKQLSEEYYEVNSPKSLDKPHAIKIAWADNTFDSQSEEGVVAKKCIKEVKKPPKVTRHNSLEKESILYSKQELAERLRQVLKEREHEKPNLNIFLAHNTTTEEEVYEEKEVATKEPPKIIPPLFTPMENTMKTGFHIRKSKESAYTFAKPNIQHIIPTAAENHSTLVPQDFSTPQLSDRSIDKTDPKAIKNVIIRPVTAAGKRERFQKRNNTAFNSIIKETVARPPLVRSSSAPCKTDQTKPKFLSTKRKVKSSKIGKTVKCPTSEDEDSSSNKENPKSKKEINRLIAVNGTDIVTMVSLVSPATSDTEEVDAEVKPKTSPSKQSIGKREESGKNTSLRKTVKTVSFQSSSIHAIRSFSASFPVRRGSMVTALMLGTGVKNQKNQEKRSTDPTTCDDEEREPKRRLVRSATDEIQKNINESGKIVNAQLAYTKEISVDIKSKTLEGDAATNISVELVTERRNEEKNVADDGEMKFGSIKEKECWDMYCKMSERGLKVSYDTILRGMLTPTEYRVRRKQTTVVDPVEGPIQQ